MALNELWKKADEEGAEAYPENDDVVATLKAQGFKKVGPGTRPPTVPYVDPKPAVEDKIAAIEKQLAELKAGR
jgi:hypothetical protein